MNDNELGAAPFVAAQNATLSFANSLDRPDLSLYLASKRAIDMLCALVVIAIVSPVILTLALLVRLDGSPAFFGQRRLGHGGRPFMLWKLRTMVPDAEKKLEDFLAQNPEARAEWDANQKLRHDPRITFVGRFLRKYSLDELPQLFNVMQGDMSLVGPRPMMVGQETLYPGEAYAGLRPGLTGLWQVSKRDDATFAARARLDATYAGSLSLWCDIRIAVLTIGYLVEGRGC